MNDLSRTHSFVHEKILTKSLAVVSVAQLRRNSRSIQKKMDAKKLVFKHFLNS